MQRTGYELVDLSLASSILKEKLNTNYANGNILKALQLYKGGNNPEALKYANQVVSKFSEVKEQMKGES